MKFVKYLKPLGWNPIVVTIKEEYYKLKDRALISEVSNVKVLRTKLMPKIFLKDEGVRWIPYLFFNIILCLKKTNAIYITVGPFPSLCLLPIIKAISNKPIIVDFRDPWWLGRRNVISSNLFAKVKRLLERIFEVLTCCLSDYLIFATPTMKYEYCQHFGFLLDKKSTVITNGFDPSDFEKIKKNKNNTFTIVYTGKFSYSLARQNINNFLGALKILDEEKVDFYFIHVGPKSDYVEKQIKKFGLSKKYYFAGILSHNDALEWSYSADLLLVLGYHKRELPGKFFDYLGTGNPILCLGPPKGDLYNFVVKTNCGFALENKDPTEIAEAIKQVINGKTFDRNEHIINSLRRKELTRNLTSILDELIK
ncbi:MAG: glycosyltransferase [Clostridiales bacterium]|nr:glycosyltransferase [Clostridiales bacterium]MCF8022792.1 glycosyltransferase [Clostridiales bacterium]